MSKPLTNNEHQEATQPPPPPSKRRSLSWFIKYWPLLLVIPVIFGLGIGTGYAIWGMETPSPTSGPTPQGVTPTPQSVTRYDVPIDDDPSMGPEDAEITIIEFSDYECPFCKKWHDETLGRLMEAYEGRIRFVYRDFPLNGHVNAVSAAEAANCAGEQDAYWGFHSALFSDQYGLGEEAYRQYAEDLDLDVEAFSLCMQEHRYYDEVIADWEYASNLGVRATPTFFINGIPVEGALPFESFQQLIEMELAGQLQ